MCKKLNAFVPLPRNDQENTDLFAACLTLGFKHVALGANDLKKEGLWVDLAGKPLNYTNWWTNDKIEPNNHGGNQHYLRYWPRFNGKWDDGEGYSVANIVCGKLIVNG